MSGYTKKKEVKRVTVVRQGMHYTPPCQPSGWLPCLGRQTPSIRGGYKELKDLMRRKPIKTALRMR